MILYFTISPVETSTGHLLIFQISVVLSFFRLETLCIFLVFKTSLFKSNLTFAFESFTFQTCEIFFINLKSNSVSSVEPVNFLGTVFLSIEIISCEYFLYK